MDSLLSQVFGRHTSAPPAETKHAITQITEEVLGTFLGDSWRRRGFKHLTFRSEVFDLESIEGLLRCRLDLTFLESLDVSENSLKELDCIAGESAQLTREQVPQGVMFFSNLQVLKVRKNLLTNFKARLPSLRELDLSHNKLQAIPPTFLLPKLEVLLLNHNNINGSFVDLRKCEALKRLDLSFNQFDFNASRLRSELKHLAHLSSLILKIKDNPFSATFPTYQVLVLQELHQLRKLDDISDMSSARQAASSVTLNLKKLDEFAFRNQDSKAADNIIKNSTATAAVFRAANKKTVFAEISGYLVRALQDPNSVQIAVAGLTRLTHTISQCLPEDMANLQEELTQGSLKPREKIQTLMGDFEVLAGRVAGPNQKILLLRAVAKLSVVDVEGLGVECMKLLRKLTELNPHLEDKVMGMLQEMIIHPLKNYNKEKDHKERGTESQQRVGSYLRILANFDSPSMGKALQPITTELVKWYCQPRPEEKQQSARFSMFAAAASPVTEDLDPFAIVQLTERWSSCVENLKLKELPDSDFTAITQKLSQILEAEAARPIYDHDPKAYAETMAHLGLALNLLHSKVPRVEKVFRSNHNKNSIHQRALHKVVMMFGNAKKAEPNTSVKMDMITTEGEIMIAKLFDVLAAFLDLNDSNVFAEDILDGAGLLPRFVTAILKEDPITKPYLLGGALRMAKSILTIYEDVKEPHAEAVTDQIIKAMGEMRPMMKLLSMQGVTFESFWKACTHEIAGRTTQALPKHRTLEQPLVLQIFEAIIRLVSFFSLADGPQYAEVKKVVSHQREELMFQMLTVPNAKVKVAALECVGTASVADTSTSEVETLIGFLDVKGEELQSSFTYLQKIVAQLNKMLTAPTGQGAMALRTTQAKACKEGVFGILVRTARYVPTNDEVLRARVSLLQACLQFLHAAGSLQEWRLQLRSKMATMAVVTTLQCEDNQGLQMPDISVERTWTGRSVEALLMTLSGPEKLRPRSKVALRVISRMADILQGQADHAAGAEEIEALPEYIIEELMAEEAKPWEEEKVKKQLGFMDDVTREDWRVQQEIFTSANGLERVELFLGGILGERQRTEAKQREAALLTSANNFLEDAKARATHQSTNDGASDSASEDSEDAFNGITEEPVIDMPAREFPGKDGPGAFEDLRQNFASRLQGVFSILFTARWYSFQNSSPIIDFGDGPGQENIIIANQGRQNTLVFQVYRRGNLYQAVVPASLKLNETCTFLCTLSEEGSMYIYTNGQIVGSSNHVPPAAAAAQRKYLYVGKSCWTERELFHGRIEQLKVWSGQVVDWEDVAEDFGNEDDGGLFDRKLIMKELFTVPEAPAEPPKVHGTINLLARRHLPEETDMRSRGELDSGYIVAATLRCAYALLQAPASPKAEHEMVSTLLDSAIVCRLLTLSRTCGPFNCSCALKILKLMGAVLELRSDVPDVDMLVTCDLLMGYVSEVVGDAVKAMQENGNSKQEMGRLLSAQIAQVCSVICKLLPYCKYPDDDAQGQKTFLECCYDRLVPASLIPSLVRMALYADESPSQTQMVEDVRMILVKLMERCPVRKRDTVEVLCSILLSGEVDNGLAWMSELHEAVKISEAERQREEMEAAKAYGTQKVKIEDGQPERALGTYNVEVLLNGRRLEVSNPSHHAPFLNLVVTNKAVYVVDPTVPGYPRENTGQIQECIFKKADVIRLTRGFLDQGLFLGVKSGVAPEEGETTIPFIFHRRNARENALSKLTQLKKLPVDQDKMTEEAVMTAIRGHGKLLSATHMAPENSLLASVLMRDSSMKLFILSEAAVHDFQVDFSKWRPQREDELDDGQADSSVPLQPDVKALRDSTDRDTTPELWLAARQGLLTRVGEVRPLSKLDTVAFFPDSRPRVEMTFQEMEGVNVVFYDELSKEHWRESMMAVLKQEDDGTGGGWSRNVNGAKMPLAG